jgi:hypothetical protein
VYLAQFATTGRPAILDIPNCTQSRHRIVGRRNSRYCSEVNDECTAGGLEIEHCHHRFEHCFRCRLQAVPLPVDGCGSSRFHDTAGAHGSILEFRYGGNGSWFVPDSCNAAPLPTPHTHNHPSCLPFRPAKRTLEKDESKSDDPMWAMPTAVPACCLAW